MAKRSIGDIYEVKLNEVRVGFFQHVAYDDTQMKSSVIRVFALRTVDSLTDLPHTNVAFHVHVALNVGERMNVWRKVGHASVIPPVNPCFRMCDDYGDPSVETSRNWSVWEVNRPRKWVGALDAQTRGYEIGLIVNPLSVVHRMRSGSYDFAIPA